MADTQPLNSQQQEKLSKIMATPVTNVPTNSPPPATAYQVAEVENPVADVPESKGTNKVDTEELSGSRRKILPILFTLLGVLLLGGYAVFWLVWFKFLKLF